MASSGGMYEYGMGLDDDDDEYEKGHREGKPSIVLMGAKRSGKTSIRKVVFQKMSPNETLFVESTSRVVTHTVTSSFIDFETKEFPGQLSPFDPAFDPQNTFSRCGALVFIIDAQDDYTDALKMLNDYVVKAYKMNSNIKFEVFVHKVDSLGDDLKIETHRDIYNRANDDLVDAQHENIHLSFHTTSIYDHSIFEAFSKVVQKLIPQLPTLERLLDIFNQSSCVEKCFLFDIASKIYVATDSTPVDMQTYELCCDMIDLQVDVSCIYGSVNEGNASPRSDEVECDEVVGRGASCVIRLSTHQVLYLREVNTYLALVCIVKEENFEKQGLIDYNFQCFKKAIDDVFELRRRMLRQKAVLKSRNNRDSATDTDISSDTDNRL